MYDNKFAEEQGRMLAVERRNLIKAAQGLGLHSFPPISLVYTSE